MNTPRKTSSPPTAEKAKARSGRPGERAQDLQPPPTGANRGSPAAPVMKQFAKTRAESGGKP